MKLTSLALLALLLVGSAGAGCLGQDAEDTPDALDLAADDDTLAGDNATAGMAGNATDLNDNATVEDNATGDMDNGTAGNETEPEPTPPASTTAPAKPEDHVAGYDGWIEPVPEGFVVTHAFPVEKGVLNVSIRVDFSLVDPSGQAPQGAPLQWTVTILSPGGDTVANASNLQAGAGDGILTVGDGDGASFDLGDLAMWGDYVLRIEARGGGSDGSSWGHRYDASIYVDY